MITAILTYIKLEAIKKAFWFGCFFAGIFGVVFFNALFNIESGHRMKSFWIFLAATIVIFIGMFSGMLVLDTGIQTIVFLVKALLI